MDFADARVRGLFRFSFFCLLSFSGCFSGNPPPQSTLEASPESVSGDPSFSSLGGEGVSEFFLPPVLSFPSLPPALFPSATADQPSTPHQKESLDKMIQETQAILVTELQKHPNLPKKDERWASASALETLHQTVSKPVLNFFEKTCFSKDPSPSSSTSLPAVCKLLQESGRFQYSSNTSPMQSIMTFTECIEALLKAARLPHQKAYWEDSLSIFSKALHPFFGSVPLQMSEQEQLLFYFPSFLSERLMQQFYEERFSPSFSNPPSQKDLQVSGENEMKSLHRNYAVFRILLPHSLLMRKPLPEEQTLRLKQAVETWIQDFGR